MIIVFAAHASGAHVIMTDTCANDVILFFKWLYKKLFDMTDYFGVDNDGKNTSCGYNCTS